MKSRGPVRARRARREKVNTFATFSLAQFLIQTRMKKRETDPLLFITLVPTWIQHISSARLFAQLWSVVPATLKYISRTWLAPLISRPHARAQVLVHYSHEHARTCAFMRSVASKPGSFTILLYAMTLVEAEESREATQPFPTSFV